MISYKDAAHRIDKALDYAAAEDKWHKYGEGYTGLRNTMSCLKVELEASYNNPATCVVVVAMVDGKLALIRRGLKDGFGKLALPGGFQAPGESWEQAGAREFREETGIKIDAEDLGLMDIITVENGKINLIFCFYEHNVTGYEIGKRDEAEVIELVLTDVEPDESEIAFETHAAVIRAYFDYIAEEIDRPIPADSQA